MSAAIELTNEKKAAHLLRASPEALELAVVAALNRAVLAGRTAVSKGMRVRYTIRAADVKGAMNMKVARRGQFRALLTARGAPIDLMKFKVRIGRKGIFAQVKKGGGGKLPHTFFVSAGRAGLYHRAATTRLPILREYGPSIPQMAGETNVSAAVNERMEEVFQTHFMHEVNYRLEELM